MLLGIEKDRHQDFGSGGPEYLPQLESESENLSLKHLPGVKVTGHFGISFNALEFSPRWRLASLQSAY